MKKQVLGLIDEAKSKMGAYCALLNYQLACFCVKAEPMALLPVDVETDEDSQHLEEVADVAIPQEDQYALYPKEDSYSFAISKAVAQAYPEFKIEVNEDDKSIICTIPPVNEDRKKAGLDYTDTAYKFAETKIDAVMAAISAKLAVATADAPENDKKEAGEKLNDVREQSKKMCDQFKEDKEKEIEEAYQNYLKKEAEKELAQKEESDSAGVNAGKSFSLK